MHNLTKNLKAEFYRSRNLVFVVFVFCMAVAFSFIATGNMRTSSAASTSNFKAGNIISDAVMSNSNAMSLAEIQNFLNSKNKCDNRNYDEYLQLSSKYSNITWHWEGEPYNGHFVCLAEERFGDTASEIGSGMTAAEIIYAAAQENRINPQVLLVLLQKESSLITDKIPNSLDYSKATGYGCPDTAACDTKYSGFKNQVYRAAELFRYTLDYGSVSYPEGRNVYIGYNPSSSCGGSQVYIENRATASLYRYTPYQPNAAALNAGYGTGDICSAYGNRNFYLYFTDWFGSTQAAVDGELTDITEGIYSLIVQSDNTAIQAKNNRIIAADYTGDSDQRWLIQKDSNTGYYTLKNLDSGAYLSTANQNAGIGTSIQTSDSANSCSVLWKIYVTKTGDLALETSCANGMVLGTDGSNNLQIDIYGTQASQKWQLKVGRTIDDGIYNITAKTNSQQTIDLNNGSSANGANITTWSQNNGDNQKWRATYDSASDSYIFINPATGKALDATGGIARNGTLIELWAKNTSCAQKWQLITKGDGEYSIHSMCSTKYVIDLNGTPRNGAKLTLWSMHDGDNQKWQFTEAPRVIEDGLYVIQPKVSDKLAIDSEKNAEQNGANVAIWQNHDGDNQKWQVQYNLDTDDYSFINPVAGKILDIADKNTPRSTNVYIWGSNSSCGQRWKITASNDGTYQILSACNTNKALDLNGAYTSNGTNIQLWDKNTSIAQKWVFNPVQN